MEIYIKLPEGFYKKDYNKGLVAKLNKALYSLKQLLRLWYKFLYNILKRFNFILFLYNEGVFINKDI